MDKEKKQKKKRGENENRQQRKKLKQVVIKKVARCYPHTGYEFNNTKETEKLLVPILIKIELMKITNTRNKTPQHKIKHSIKLTVNDKFDLQRIDNVKIIIGFGMSVTQIYKSELDMEFEKKHICEVIMRKCVQCRKPN